MTTPLDPRLDPRFAPRPAAPRRREPSRIPVRGAIGIGVTAAGMAFLLSLRPPAAGGEFALALDATTTEDTSAVTAEIVAASPTAIASASPVASATACETPAASADPSASANPDASASASDCMTASSSPVATASPTATPAPTGLTGTATGDAVSFRFGTVQVQVTVADGVLTEVVALQLPDGDRRSASISSQVEPWLAEEVIAAQSASIDIISGATYTSRAYAQSLQSALDRLAA